MTTMNSTWTIKATSRTGISTQFLVKWDGREVEITGGWMSRIKFLACSGEYAKSEARAMVKRSGYDI